MKLSYLMTGVIDGAYLEVLGTGAIDQSIGEFSLDLSVRAAPLDWDPAIIVLICCDNLRFFSAEMSNPSKIAGPRAGLKSLQFGGAVNSQREGIIVAPNGDTVASLKAKGYLFIDPEEVKSRTVILSGQLDLNRFGGISEILTPYVEKITPTGPATATGLSVYSVRAADGTMLTGHTVYPYVFLGSPPPPANTTLEVHMARVNSAEYRAGTDSPKISVRVREI